jgi:hypothetical protein
VLLTTPERLAALKPQRDSVIAERAALKRK